VGPDLAHERRVYKITFPIAAWLLSFCATNPTVLISLRHANDPRRKVETAIDLAQVAHGLSRLPGATEHTEGSTSRLDGSDAPNKRWRVVRRFQKNLFMRSKSRMAPNMRCEWHRIGFVEA